MCGITGYWNLLGAKRAAFPVELKHAISSLDHRGPDDSGRWTNESKQLGLGHARLSILDLSQHGHQPMLSEGGRFVLVYNGEIYNFSEIREELERHGHHFQGTGDTEVLLAAFEKWGQDCVQRFIGMFAFAIWDKKNKKLSLCRDRVGVKPLYYGWNGKIFCFGSELKALRAYKHWTPEINRQALGEFLQYGYIAAPRTIYQGISKLSPGHWLEISLRNPHPRIHPYWSLKDVVNRGTLEGTEGELTDQLEELLINAFQYRMVADVPVGVFLSGGIDSSIVAALLQKHSTHPIHTFTIGFKDKAHDESGWARKIANHLGTEHTEYILDLERAQEIIPLLPSIYDEPFGDSSCIPTTMVSQLAQSQVTVALSADGGDELFAGYSRYTLMPGRAKAISSKPVWLRRFTAKALRSMPDALIDHAFASTNHLGLAYPSKVMRKFIKLRSVLPHVNTSTIFHSSLSHFMPEEIDQLIGGYEDPRQSVDSYSGTFVERMAQWDLEHYLSDDILTKVDRATMSVSLEGREPLLDHRVIEFAYRLPLDLRIGNFGQKHLLRKVLYRHVPRNLIERPKQGFAIPINSWLRHDDGDLTKRITETGILSYLGLDSTMIKREVNLLHRAGVNETRVWLLFILERWAEQWLR